MSDLVLHTPTINAIALPEPRGGDISVRLATMEDIPFIDALQKKHSKMVGWFPLQWFEDNITNGNVLIAEQRAGMKAERHEGIEKPAPDSLHASMPSCLNASSPSMPSCLNASSPSMPSCLNASMPAVPVGYVIAQDKYLKREELGIVYQLNVLPMKQRGLIGATLIKHVFDRAAYGCKLFCCWCAQDLEANYFWESIGFVPLAFRTGSRKAGQKKEPRTHIFWQRRIREGDAETPYWFPSETQGGALREARLVLPIPPNTHWSDAKPAILPGMEMVNVVPQLESDKEKKPRNRVGAKKPVQVVKPSSIKMGGLRAFAPPPPTPEEIARAKEEKKKARPPKFKNDPKLVAAARELRDRYTEQINAGLLLPPSACGKYDVSRALEAAPSAMKQRCEQTRLLDAA